MIQGIERVTSARPQPQTLYGLLTNTGLRSGNALPDNNSYNTEAIHKRMPQNAYVNAHSQKMRATSAVQRRQRPP
jgi:hypothetical protein